MTFSALSQYLAQLEARSPEAKIELGLTRVNRAYQRLFQDAPWSDTSIITIAGTNGKGSTVSFCEAIGRSMGLNTFAYTSPHIQRFTERARINGGESEGPVWLDAFTEVDRARDEIPLTYFEQVTLAALWMAAQQPCDLLILEVGLGGRLDAVNVVDADVAILTSIGMDHMEFLGPTRTHIGREKLGIARAGRPLVIGERDWIDALDRVIADSGAAAYRIGQAFDWTADEASPEWTVRIEPWAQSWRLHRPQLMGEYQLNNAACAVVAMASLFGDKLKEAELSQSLQSTQLAGRFETVSDAPTIILDVAHNAQAARALASALEQNPAQGRTLAVFSALVGKDVEAMVDALAGKIDHWFVGGLGGPRGQSGQSLANRLRNQGITVPIEAVESICEAADVALKNAKPEDRVIIFGSFQVLAELRSRWRAQ